MHKELPDITTKTQSPAACRRLAAASGRPQVEGIQPMLPPGTGEPHGTGLAVRGRQYRTPGNERINRTENQEGGSGLELKLDRRETHIPPDSGRMHRLLKCTGQMLREATKQVLINLGRRKSHQASLLAVMVRTLEINC